MKKIIYTISALLLFSNGIFAQNYIDALRYSDYKISGTARSAAMGNAFGALGGDFTSLSINPAGLGVYRSSEFTITSSFGNTNIEGSYLNKKTSDSKYKFQFPSLGYVATFKTQEGTSSLININFGIGYNRMSDFNMRKLVTGTGAISSMLDAVATDANNGTWGDIQEGAYRTYLINADISGTYSNVIEDESYGQSQRYKSRQEGNLDEYVFSLATNFNHKLYLGMTVGLHDVDYEEINSLYEYDPNNDIYDFNDYYYDSHLRTTGSGYNFKFGVIFKPIKQLRLGLSWHSPTFYKLKDTYQTSMNSSFDNGDYYEYTSDVSEYDYKLETPSRTTLSAAYIIGKKGLISVDYEYVNYSSAKLKEGGDGYDFYNENEDISELYKSVGNLHIGGEYRVNDLVSLRAGYEYYSNPYESYALEQDQPSSKYSTVSAGVGYNQGNFFLDMTYKHKMAKDYSTIYSGSDFVEYNMTNDKVMLTLGFKF